MEPLRKQVEDISRKIDDLLDDHSAPAANHLRSEVRALENDLQSGKNPITCEDRVKRIIHILEGEAKSARIMNYEHLDMFKHWFEHLRETLRRMG